MIINFFTSGISEAKDSADSSKNFEVINNLASQSLRMYSTSLGCNLQLMAVYFSPLLYAAADIEKNNLSFSIIKAMLSPAFIPKDLNK